VKNHDGFETGAEDRTRTGDLLITNQWTIIHIIC